MSFLIYNTPYSNLLSQNKNFGNIGDLIKSSISEQAIENLIIIVPTKRIVRYLENEIINIYFNLHKKPIAKLHIYNLDDFVTLIFEKLFGAEKYRFVSDALRLVLIEEALKNADLKYYKFSKNRIKLELIRKLSDLIYGIRQDGYSSEQAQKELELDEVENYHIFDKRKNNDIIKLLITYEELLGDKLIDKPIMYRLLNNFLKANLNSIDLFNEAFCQLFSKEAIITAIGFSEFKNPEAEFFSLISPTIIPVSFFFDYSEANGPLFGNFQDIIRNFIDIGYKSLSDDDFVDFSDENNNDSDNYFLRKNLFNYNVNAVNPNFSDYITIFKSTNIEDEVKYIAKLVKYLNLKENIPLDKIAIVSRNPKEYSEMFRDIFRKERIPANISDRFILKDSHIVNLIIEIINLFTSNFKIEQLEKVLKSSNIKIDFDIDFQNFADVLQGLKISKFYYSFKKKYIPDRVANFEKHISSLLLSNRLDYHQKKNYENWKQKIKIFNEDYKKLAQLFDYIPKNMNIKEFQDIVLNIINQFKIKDALKEKVKKSLKVKNLTYQFDYFLALDEIEKETTELDKFVEMLKDMVTTFEARFTGVGAKIEDWLERLKIAIADERYQIQEKIGYGVTITSIEQIRMLPIQVKILCGANDGIFPLAYATENMLGKELLHSRITHLQSERMTFYQFLSNNNLLNLSAKQRVFIFYPQTKGSEFLSPSPFLESIIKISDLKKKNKIISISNAKDDQDILKQYPWLNAITNRTEFIDYIINLKLKNVEISELLSKFNANNEIITIKEIDRLLQIIQRENSSKIVMDSEQIDELYGHYFSISELEKYAKCPYKYFSENILKITAPEVKDLKISYLEEGSLLHNILFKFYSYCLKNNESVINLTLNTKNKQQITLPAVSLVPSKLNQYSTIILEMIKEELKNPIYDHPFISLQLKNYLEASPAKNKIIRWLEAELQKISSGWNFLPFAFEEQIFTEFDKDDFTTTCLEANPEISASYKPIKILAKPDKIEISNCTSNDLPDYYVAITDYKLSSSSISNNIDIIEKKNSFQMPVYLKAIIKKFSETNNVDLKPAFAVYYKMNEEYNVDKSTKNFAFVLLTIPDLVPDNFRPKRKTKDLLLLDNTTIDEILDNTLKEIFGIREKIIQGVFPIKPDLQNICKYCVNDILCRRRVEI